MKWLQKLFAMLVPPRVKRPKPNPELNLAEERLRLLELRSARNRK